MNTLTVFVVIASIVAPAFGRGLDWSEIEQSYNNPIGRITNGKLAEPKQFPYQAGLRLYLSNGHSWCGGTVISERWIVTAAHCTDALKSGVDVYLGTWNREDRTEKGQQVIFVGKNNVIVHEGWQPLTLANDISLIKLPVPIEFNDYIQPASLPKIGDTRTFEGEVAIASGWGRNSTKYNNVTDKLRWAETPVISNSECLPSWTSLLLPTNICIRTTGGISTCHGDSGGPLVLADGSQTLIGATSFGTTDCEQGTPAAFTRISSYVDWIAKHTGIQNE